MRDCIMVVGGGMMGCGIAAVAAAAANKVIVAEPGDTARQAGPGRVLSLLRELAENGLLDGEPQSLAENVSFAANWEDGCGRACFVIEAIIENLEAKQEVFQKLDSMLPPEVPIVSNTSGLRITDIGKLAVHKERIVTAHFWFPAHIVPLVEVVMGDGSSLACAEAVRDRLKGWGKAPVIVKRDLPGQLANRILQAMIRETVDIVQSGLATPEDVDTAIKMGLGVRLPAWGILEHADGVGVDLVERVQRTVLPDIADNTQPAPLLEQMVKEGRLGHKSGQGFYDWSEKDMDALVGLRNDMIITAVKLLRKHGKLS